MAELVREIMIDATPDTIWPFLTEADKHVEWEGTEAEIDPRPGGVYRVLVAGELPGAGEFVEVVPKERLVFTFGWEQEGNPITPGSTDRGDHPAPRRQQDPRCASSIGACPTTTPSSSTSKGGRTTSTAWPCGPPVATRARTAGPSGSDVMDLVEGARPRPGDRPKRSSSTSDREQLALPTPCAEFDVRTLLRHMIAGNDRFAAVARGEPIESRPGHRRPSYGDDAAPAYRASAAAVSAAWHDPGVLERRCSCPSARCPAMLRSPSTRSRPSCTVGTSRRRRASRPRSSPSCARSRGRRRRASATTSAAPAGRSALRCSWRRPRPTPIAWSPGWAASRSRRVPDLRVQPLPRASNAEPDLGS